MSMSTTVVGFMPADEKWVQMKAIFDNCIINGIDPPQEVWEFFGGDSPEGDPGRIVKLDSILTPITSNCESGYELEVAKIPANVKFIRFINSWWL